MMTYFLMIRLLCSSLFFIPFVALYANRLGLDLTQIMVVEGFFSVLVLLLDLPTAHLSDRWGLKKLYQLGILCAAIGYAALYFFPVAWIYWTVQVLFALSCSVLRGLDSAILSRLCELKKEDGLYLKWETRFVRGALVAESLSFSLGALVVKFYSETSTFLVTFLVHVVALILTTRLPGQLNESDQVAGSVNSGTEFLHKVKKITQTLFGSSQTVLFAACSVFIGAMFSTLNYLFPVIAVQNGLSRANVGFIFSFATIVAAGIPFLFKGKKFGLMTYVVAMSAGLFLICGSHLTVLLLGFVIVRVVTAEILPVLRSEMRSRFMEYGHATAMSINSVLFSAGFAIFGPFIGYAVQAIGYSYLVMILIVLFWVMILPSLLINRSVRNV